MDLERISIKSNQQSTPPIPGLNVDATHTPGSVALLLSEQGGLVRDDSLLGVPFYQVRSGGWFFTLHLGQTDFQGNFTLTTSIPEDPSLVAFSLNAQALIAAYHGGRAVTNGVVRVLGE